MADLAISQLDLINSFDLDFQVEVYRPNEVLAEDRNVRMQFTTLFGAMTFASSTSLPITSAPHVYVFNGTSTATWTLPAGNANLINVPIRFANIGTADLNIEGNGAEEIEGSDPFNIPGNFDKTVYTFRWNGTKWLVS